jgi:hypothetical protein
MRLASFQIRPQSRRRTLATLQRLRLSLALNRRSSRARFGLSRIARHLIHLA